MTYLSSLALHCSGYARHTHAFLKSGVEVFFSLYVRRALGGISLLTAVGLVGMIRIIPGSLSDRGFRVQGDEGTRLAG